MINQYRDFAAVYDRLTEDVDYAGLAERWLYLFHRYGKRPETLLDLACGSGSLSLELLRRGVDVIGVDGSEDMLLAAREKAEEAGFSPLFLCQDMRELDLFGTVEGCVCALDSLNHLTKTEDLKTVFSRVSLFVEPGGLFLFDVNTPFKHREVLADRVFAAEEAGVFCTWQNRWISRTCEIETELDFFEEQPDGRYERSGDRVRERAYTLPTLRRLLAQTEWEVLAVYDAATLAEPQADCLRWLLVARNVTRRYETCGGT